MANQFITTDLVSNTALAMFANNAPFVMTALNTGASLQKYKRDNWVNSGNISKETILIQASKEEGATTRAKARTTKWWEAPNNRKVEDMV